MNDRQRASLKAALNVVRTAARQEREKVWNITAQGVRRGPTLRQIERAEAHLSRAVQHLNEAMA